MTGDDRVRGLAAAAELAGVGESSIRRLIRAGKLTSQRDDDGAHVFARRDLEALAEAVDGSEPGEGDDDEARDDDSHEPRPDDKPDHGDGAVAAEADHGDGAMAAEAFALFATGKGPRDVVIELRRPPAVIARLWGEWCSMGGDLIIPSQVRRQIEKLVGRIEPPAALLALIERLTVAYRERKQFSYRCCKCDEVILAGEAEWSSVRERFEKSWRHTECADPDG